MFKNNQYYYYFLIYSIILFNITYCDIVFGQNIQLNNEFCIRLRDGLRIGFNQQNENGGIFGQKIYLEVKKKLNKLNK
jgi:hypothetical protein